MIVYSRVPSLQPSLSTQIEGIKAGLDTFHLPQLLGVLLFGSSARGLATYRSDVDLLFILNAPRLGYTTVTEVRDQFETHFNLLHRSANLHEPLEVQATIVLESVFDTQEPEMRKALNEGRILLDPTGALARAQHPRGNDP